MFSSSALLSDLLVCNWESREIQQHTYYVHFDRSACHFSDGNHTVCPTLKNKSWLPIMPKQRERCLDVHYIILHCVLDK
jgi:hypothetical protein